MNASLSAQIFSLNLNDADNKGFVSLISMREAKPHTLGKKQSLSQAAMVAEQRY